MWKLGCSSAAMIISLIAACGGKSVVDAGTPTGTGGAGATTTTTTSSTSSSSSTTSSGTGAAGGSGGSTGMCDLLQEELENSIWSAQLCDPLINALQCTGQTVITDVCGCELVANDLSPESAEEAQINYDYWVAEGCGPFLCADCPPPPSAPWYCDPNSKMCEPAYE